MITISWYLSVHSKETRQYFLTTIKNSWKAFSAPNICFLFISHSLLVCNEWEINRKIKNILKEFGSLTYLPKISSYWNTDSISMIFDYFVLKTNVCHAWTLRFINLNINTFDNLLRHIMHIKLIEWCKARFLFSECIAQFCN